MIYSQLDTTLERYEVAINNLNSSNIEIEQVLGILHARDTVQVALKEPKHIPNSSLNKLILLDAQLEDKAAAITKVIKSKELENWRRSVHPPAEAWWWKLESIAPHPWDTWDWLWKLLSVVGWTANISLLVNIATRFLGGGGAGLFGVAAVSLPSILTLLQASSQFTKVGQEGFDKLLDKKIPILGKKISKEYHQEIKLGLTLLMSGFLTGFCLCLPVFSNIYHRNGLNNFDKKNLGSAEQEFKTAISLNSDNTEAHYDLGNLYEEWLQIKKAKEQYQIAIAGDLPQAYNNLGRLYIKEKKYPEAAALLIKGFFFANNSDLDKPELKYSLLKNLGWARLKQERYKEAVVYLKEAISISQNPDNRQHIPNPGAANCLIAKVLEKQKLSKEKTLSQWQKCLDSGSVTNPDEDNWLHIARQKLGKENK